MYDVLAIGELLADLIGIEYADDLSKTKSFKIFQGGSPANLCANLKWLGKNVVLVASVGNDGVGKMITESIKKVGLDDLYIKKINTCPTSIVLVSKSKSSPDFIAYREADIQIDKIDDTLISNSNIIHTSAFALSKEPAKTNIISALISAKNLGKKISIDWNFSPKIWGDEDGFEVFKIITSLKPLLKISLDDIERFTNKKYDDLEEVKSFLDKYQAEIICLTLGADGVWVRTESLNWVKFDAIKSTNVVDSTGAGDAFWAGFLSDYSTTNDYECSVKNALKVAYLKIQKEGPLYL
jgi:fructokinase